MTWGSSVEQERMSTTPSRIFQENAAGNGAGTTTARGEQGTDRMGYWHQYSAGGHVIRIFIENERIGPASKVNAHNLLLKLNRLEWLECEGLKHSLAVNGVFLTRDQIYRPLHTDMYEWADHLLTELALKATKRRTAARQNKADLTLGINKALRFGL